MYEFIGFCFDGDSNTSVAVSQYGDKIIYDPSTYPVSYNKKALKKAVKYSLQHCERWYKNVPKDYKCSYVIDSSPFVVTLMHWCEWTPVQH